MTKFQSPAHVDTAMEGVRTGVELINSAFGYARDLVTPDPEVWRAPVMVIPGFMAHDMTTYALRSALRPEGYHAYDSNTGFNLGVVNDIAQRQQDQLDRIFEEHDGQKVGLIGHSLGGIQVMHLAYNNPDKVSSVTTLGSPFGGAMDKSGVNRMVEWVFVLLNSHDREIQDSLRDRLNEGPPDMPVMSIYSPHDGVVSADSAQNPWADDYADIQNVEIAESSKQSHLGMVCSVDVLNAVKDHLNQHSDVVTSAEHALVPA